jgi:hypothetical protein
VGTDARVRKGALAAGLVTASAGTAQAASVLVDNFGSPATLTDWKFTHSGDGGGGFSNLQTHSGTRDAFIFMRNSGFSSVGRTCTSTARSARR